MAWYLQFLYKIRETQKRLQINRRSYEDRLRALINTNAIKVSYLCNVENVFLWGGAARVLLVKLKRLWQINRIRNPRVNNHESIKINFNHFDVPPTGNIM
jgi:hypothetical protein